MTALPAGLRERVLAAATAARAAGRATPEVEEISPAEAFSRAASALSKLLGALDEGQWRLHVLRDLDVQGLVGHLVGVEEGVQRGLSGDAAAAEGDHVSSTQAAALRQAGRPPAETLDEWREATRRTIAALGEDGTPVAVHGLRLPLGSLLLVRAFELWTHENDIRRAAGLAPSVPDAPTLHAMTGLATGLLPFGAAVIGLTESTRLRLVLTGPGGGTWTIPIGDGGAGSLPVGSASPETVLPETVLPETVSIVVDAVGFCRLVANRVTPEDLEVHVAGDEARAAGVLAAASALALD